MFPCAQCGSPVPPSVNRCPNCGFGTFQTSSFQDDAAMRVLLPVGRSWFAIVAGYLGLVSPLMCTAPFAILFGILALLDLKKNPKLGGIGRAWFGLIMGTIFTLLPAVLILIGILTGK